MCADNGLRLLDPLLRDVFVDRKPSVLLKGAAERRTGQAELLCNLVRTQLLCKMGIQINNAAAKQLLPVMLGPGVTGGGCVVIVALPQ